MPLLDHFHPPLSERRQWHSFYSVWASMIALDLNRQLPPGYFADPNVEFNKNGPCIKLDLDATYMRTLQEQRMLAAGTGVAVGPAS